MLNCYHQVSSIWQILLLVCSQFTMISLAGCLIILYKWHGKKRNLLLMGMALLVNIVMYVFMQLNSRITGNLQSRSIHIPCIVLILILGGSLVWSAVVLLNETNHRTTINDSAIKEAFDNLPTGVCFFNTDGLPVLCNLAMHRFCFAVSGRDVQFISDLEMCQSNQYIPMEGIRKEGKLFTADDGRAWQLERRSITQESGHRYIQYIAVDVSDLQKTRMELMGENEQLRKVQSDLKRLSANVVTVTREEEILNTKMRVHDEMGRCLIAATQYLKQENQEEIPVELVSSWQKAVSMLKYNNDAPEEDMLLQIRKTCEYLNVAFIQKGELPKQEAAAYVLTCAIRECVTNAVRYAEATELYTELFENEKEAGVVVTNNGNSPTHEIVEGGGLSNLRHRVERAGGMMYVQSVPAFRLTVVIPKKNGGSL